MKLLDELLLIEKEERTTFDILFWWELKRVFYNIIVLIFGLLSLKIMALTIELELGEDLVEPIAIIGFGISSNFCYTLGWITELMLINNSRIYGPRMFKIGLFFTVLVVMLPAFIHLFIWALNFITK